MREIIVTSVAVLVSVWPGWSRPKEKEAPSWVTEVATRATPTYSGRVPAAVLLYEQKVTVDSTGMVDTITRQAIKVLTHEGKRDAEVVEAYERGGRQVKDLRAWLVAPGGLVKTYEKNNIQDLGAYSDELYNDFRLRRISANNAELGSVFVYESDVQQQATEAQDRFAFQSNLPAVESRYSITVPTGWTVTGRLLNHEPILPIVDGNTSTWVLKNLAFREREEYAPHLYGTAALLAVDFKPPTDMADLPCFKAWSDVSRFYTKLAEPQGEVTPEMAAKVRELTAGLSSDYDKVRAIGHYVQKFRYVEIAMDLSNYGGARPHPAPQVFAKQYGDCKDKANLMRALLKSAGIPSYWVIIFSGDRTFVKKDWPSPSQFNHMILAVQINQATKTPTAFESPVGRVLLFDPTDNKTPLGDLPYYLQDSYALICAGAGGDLVRIPVMAPDANLLTQTVEASLDATGSIKASVASESTGQTARRERGLAEGTPEQYKAAMENYLSYYVKGASVSDVNMHDAYDQNRFTTSLKFSSDHYAQSMQSRMLVFNVAVVEPMANRFPAVMERKEPILLNGKVYRKHVAMKLPAGFTVDEMPSPLTTKTAFAQFTVAYRQEPGQLIMDEELRTETVTLPASQYAEVKKFFDTVYGADNQNAVLVKN